MAPGAKGVGLGVTSGDRDAIEGETDPSPGDDGGGLVATHAVASTALATVMARMRTGVRVGSWDTLGSS
jgi:hypothetical protein